MNPDQQSNLYVDVIEVPAAAPWDQLRAARMKAELGAPLPADQLAISLRRLGQWSSRTPGRFAVGYMRASLLAREQQRQVAVAGQSVTFLFRDAEMVLRRRRAHWIDSALAAAAVLSMLGATLKWRLAHEVSQASLQVRAHTANLQLREHRRAERQIRNLAILQRDDLLGRSGPRIAADLVWLDAVRNRQAPLTQVVWQDRDLLVTTQTGQSPAAQAQLVAGAPGQWRLRAAAPRPPDAGPSVVSRPPSRRAKP